MVEENGILEVLERLVIELELASESAIRNPATLAQQVHGPVEHPVEIHSPLTLSVLAARVHAAAPDPQRPGPASRCMERCRA